MNRFKEGAVSPLSSIWCRVAGLVGILLLTACSQHASPPAFITSGYADNDGAVRIWRKDSNDETHLLSVFSPWHHGHTTKGEYWWQNGKLQRIDLNIYTTPVERIRARFDSQGELSFMQHEVDGQKQPLTDDQIALYRYRAEHIHQISDALRQGNVVLHQGHWDTDQRVTTCDGQTVKPDLSARAFAHIARRQNTSRLAVSIAWLEAPEGAQLLLVANEDYCSWQPKEKDF